MEHLAFEIDSREEGGPPRPPVLVGAVGSGNLEVLVEPGGTAAGRCRVEVHTSAGGFGAVWEAVLRDFAERHPVAGLSLAVNDGGATPAVVSLRLGQALREYRGRDR